jgi:hypothetical protein
LERTPPPRQYPPKRHDGRHSSASSEDTAAILRSLAAGISRTSKEAENQNKLQRKQLDYIKAKDAKKKTKAEKWHPTS